VTEGRQTVPPASCSDAIRQAAENLTAPCEDLKAPPRRTPQRASRLPPRLRRPAPVRPARAITTAREQGWPLRRIAAALNCSYEQVRWSRPAAAGWWSRR